MKGRCFGAKTSFGAVTLDEVGGAMTVDNQNGTVSVSAARLRGGCKNISLKTSFAPMQVRLPADAGYDVNAPHFLRAHLQRFTGDVQPERWAAIR